MKRGNERSLSPWLGLMGWVLLQACALLHADLARADGGVVRVLVQDDACPGPASVERQLAPLLPSDTELQVGADAIGGDASASVRDLGEEYTIEAEGAQRELSDPARDCVERARVAAVFIALNVKPKLEAPPPEPPVEPEPPEEPEQPDPGPDPFALGVHVFGAGAYSGEADAASPGAGAGLWVSLEHVRLSVDVAGYASADLALADSGEPAGAVALMRVPLGLSAGYMLRAGPIEAGPVLGLSLELLRLRGVDVPEPETELRFNPGGLLAMDGRLRLGRTFALAARVGVVAFPRSYHLVVDQLGRVGDTPRYWWSASLGLALRLL